MIESKLFTFNDIENYRKLGVSAMGMFISASYLSPASVIAQGARIAEQCRVKRILPRDLRMSLILRDDLMDKLVIKANVLHANNNKAPEVTADDISRIVRADFEMAEDLLQFKSSELNEIYDKCYKDFSQRSFSERALAEHVSKMFIAKGLVVPRRLYSYRPV